MDELTKRNFFFNKYEDDDLETEEEEPKGPQDPEKLEGLEEDDDLYTSDDNEFYSTEEEF